MIGSTDLVYKLQNHLVGHLATAFLKKLHLF